MSGLNGHHPCKTQVPSIDLLFTHTMETAKNRLWIALMESFLFDVISFNVFLVDVLFEGPLQLYITYFYVRVARELMLYGGKVYH